MYCTACHGEYTSSLSAMRGAWNQMKRDEAVKEHGGDGKFNFTPPCDYQPSVFNILSLVSEVKNNQNHMTNDYLNYNLS